MFCAKDLEEIEYVLESRLPTSITAAAVKNDSKLFGRRDSFCVTFMSLQEHLTHQPYLKDTRMFPLGFLPEMRALWMDTDSNYMAVFVSGPIEGRLCLVGHDTNIDCAPLYRSVEHLECAIKSGRKTLEAEWPWLVDFPNSGDEMLAKSSDAEVETDLDCIRQLHEMLKGERSPIRRRFLYSSIISLTPSDHVSDLVPFLDFPDFHVCGRACAVVGCYRFHKACEKLVQIAGNSKNYARFRAIDGLGIMRSEASCRGLKQLVRSGIYLPGNVTTALMSNFCETRTEERVTNGRKEINWYVRFPGEPNWEFVKMDDALRPLPWWRFGLDV